MIRLYFNPWKALHVTPVCQNHRRARGSSGPVAAGPLPLHHLPEADGIRRPLPRLHARAGMHACSILAPSQHNPCHHAWPTGRIQLPDASAQRFDATKTLNGVACFKKTTIKFLNYKRAGAHSPEWLHPKGCSSVSLAIRGVENYLSPLVVWFSVSEGPDGGEGGAKNLLRPSA